MPDDAVAKTARSRDWNLSAGAFARFLARLDADRDKAAAEYEQMRRRLIGLFEWWGAAGPEDLADETLDRVARKLDEGSVVAPNALGAYVRGVARMVAHEASRRPRTVALFDLPDPVHQKGRGAEPSVEAVMAALDSCLAAMAPPDRQLILGYYGAGSAPEVRRKLATDLGISPSALRVRAHRLRQQLAEDVLSRCATP